MVEFYKVEVERQGQELPAKSSDSYHFLETRLLGLIVYRKQLEQAAAKDFGIQVDQQEVEGRLKNNPTVKQEGEEGAHEDYIENAVHINLIEEKVSARIGARRLQDWIAKARREIHVEYEKGWGR
jgi:hypothetical protein